MASIFDIRARVQQIDLRGIASDIIAANSDELVKLNQEQMEQGIDADGEEITPSYRSKAYADLKQRRNPKPGHGVPDLKDTGAFYRGMFYDWNTGKMSSADAKTPSLLKKYGNVLGLNKDALSKFRPVLRQKIVEEIKTIMNGG